MQTASEICLCIPTSPKTLHRIFSVHFFCHVSHFFLCSTLLLSPIQLLLYLELYENMFWNYYYNFYKTVNRTILCWRLKYFALVVTLNMTHSRCICVYVRAHITLIATSRHEYSTTTATALKHSDYYICWMEWQIRNGYLHFILNAPILLHTHYAWRARVNFRIYGFQLFNIATIWLCSISIVKYWLKYMKQQQKISKEEAVAAPIRLLISM